MNFGLFVMGLLLFLTSLFLILLVLVQRGRGGGLTGALGGMGGQSAFGAKAGDAFTRITVGTAILWIMLCMLTIAIFNPPPRRSAEEAPAAIGAGATEEAIDEAKKDQDLPKTTDPPAQSKEKSGAPSAETVPGGGQFQVPTGAGSDDKDKKADSADDKKSDSSDGSNPVDDKSGTEKKDEPKKKSDPGK